MTERPPTPLTTLAARGESAARDITEFVDGTEPVEITEFLEADSVGRIPPFPHPLKHPLKCIAWILRTLFGIASLVVLLAVLAAIPVVNFLALGYLLEVEGRLGRNGKLRHAFPLLDLAPKLGSIALGFFLFLFPLSLLAGRAYDAKIIDPDSAATLAAGRNLWIIAGMIAVHLCLALARGGSLGCFFRPIKNVRWLLEHLRAGDYWERAEAAVKQFTADLRLKHHFWLGFRGFVGALAWLALPSALFIAVRQTGQGGQILLMLTGGVLLMFAFAWVPFLQARFAAENRLSAMFELRAVRRSFTRAPIAWLIALLTLYLLTFPLYLFKAFALPQDALWMLSLVFVASIYPTKVLLGWAWHRSTKRERPAWWGFRWGCRLVVVPLLAAYVFFLFFTRYIAQGGTQAIFEHHALLLPIPSWFGGT